MITSALLSGGSNGAIEDLKGERLCAIEVDSAMRGLDIWGGSTTWGEGAKSAWGAHQNRLGIPCEACHQKSAYWLSLIGRLSARRYDCAKLEKSKDGRELRKEAERTQRQMKGVLEVIASQGETGKVRKCFNRIKKGTLSAIASLHASLLHGDSVGCEERCGERDGEEYHTVIVEVPPRKRDTGEDAVTKLEKFRVKSRYGSANFLGRGAYGTVCSCADSLKGGVTVAIKKIKLRGMSRTELMQTLREVRVLRHLNEKNHPNILTVEDVTGREIEASVMQCEPEGLKRKLNGVINELYLTCGYMPYTLQSLVPALQADHIDLILQGLLRGVKYLHDSDIMHRDLKPANILVDHKGNTKIADFGHAIAGAGDRRDLYNYVVTRWYRAPELLLDNRKYGIEVDMWSLGCILGEMLAKKALFKGDDTPSQLKLIVMCLGRPSHQDTEFIETLKTKNFFRFLMPEKDAVPWEVTLKNVPKRLGATRGRHAIDLVSKLLEFNPAKRLDADAALNHPYMLNLDAEVLERDPVGVPMATIGEALLADEIRELLAEEAGWGKLTNDSDTEDSVGSLIDSQSSEDDKGSMMTQTGMQTTGQEIRDRTQKKKKACKRRGGQSEVTLATQGFKTGYHPFKPFTPLSPEENFKDSLDADSSPPEPVNLCVQTINKSVTPEDSTSPLSCATIDHNNSMESIGDISLGTMKNLDQNPPWCSLEQEEDGVGLYCSP